VGDKAGGVGEGCEEDRALSGRNFRRASSRFAVWEWSRVESKEVSDGWGEGRPRCGCGRQSLPPTLFMLDDGDGRFEVKLVERVGSDVTAHPLYM
jgi:hypothetical protein